MHWRAVVVLMSIAGCGSGAPTIDLGAGPLACDESFDDHAALAPVDRATLESHGTLTPLGDLRTRFLVTSPHDEAERTTRFLDPEFYAWHDEWQTFRLVNGEPACGGPIVPLEDQGLATMAEVYAWAREQDPLPLDLEWRYGGTRLYSPSYYDLQFHVTPRVFASGAAYLDGDDLVVELAATDNVDHAELVGIINALEVAVPADITVFWAPRSTGQSLLADQMEADRLLHHDRIVVLEGRTE